MNQLREDVNPVFHTAEACLLVNARMGDSDAEKLLQYLKFDRQAADPEEDNLTPEMREFVVHKLHPGFNTMVETRFTSSNKLILESGFREVVDLPCGYTPRGIKIAGTSQRYFGLDLPAVTELIGPAVEKAAGKNERVCYRAVDATNYSSLKEALAGAKGPLLITTEGMLMYFTQPELDEVLRNIRALLLEYGGEWVTTDNEMLAGQNRLMHFLTAGDPVELEKYRRFAEEKFSKSAPPENAFLQGQAAKYVGDMGFTLKKVPVYDYLPEKLHSLEHLPEEQQAAARETFREMYFWVMTADPEEMNGNRGETAGRPTEPKNVSPEDGKFHISFEHTGNQLLLSLAGRLDTITSTELLALYRAELEKGPLEQITIQMEDLSYISSAGLRVLMIMRKNVSDKQYFQLCHMKPAVMEILLAAGFDEIAELC
jgi:anti-anti-sigma factor